MIRTPLAAILLTFAAACAPAAEPARLPAAGNVPARTVCLRDGRLHVDGRWTFLKIAKPLRNFARARDVDRLIGDLATLQAKGYNALELNCYWHEFDEDGDGALDHSTQPLNRLIDAISARGMFPCLSVETYGVGGGQIPKPFFKRHHDALAVNAAGDTVRDTEYGFETLVPSIHSPDYRDAALRYIRNLAAAVDTRGILWFETTVEPQFIGNDSLDYSPHARRSYEAWLACRGLCGPAWPARFPVPEAFREHPVWNRFRAEALAEWVDADADAFRQAAGRRVLVAVDYLETDGPDMQNRNGDSLAFLRSLTAPDIIQVNWHWHLVSRAPNLAAYRNVRQVMAETGRDWAVAEHMTLNGSDYKPAEVKAMLTSALARGTRLGFEFVNVAPSSGDPFALYRDDWSPKPLIRTVDDNWDWWLRQAYSCP